MEVEGRGDFVLKEKLRLLKDKLKEWNKEVFGRIELELEECVREINLADDRLDTDSCSSFLANLELRKEANGNFWKNLRIKENMLIQKSRSKWLKEGDANSGFFHKVMKQRRRQNHLGPIITPGGLKESVEDVKEEVWNHFGNKFIETEEVRPVLDGIFFKSISAEEAMDLENHFLEGEIKEAVWECGADKSPGPDGYSFLFIKKCWYFIKDDFLKFFNYFFDGKSISKAITSSFLSLIPKTNNHRGGQEILNRPKPGLTV
ncbi:uncharacterized protein LOC131605849 [Vicia villosa]|uniref:uncharacterized protein LOC131605849 n=1 Tax=Vicia villosa TaxID=3911 RepID=UPI00273BDBC1|nr:uncharacterized protein LOC131605849 [Vicia villosa]